MQATAKETKMRIGPVLEEGPQLNNVEASTWAICSLLLFGILVLCWNGIVRGEVWPFACSFALGLAYLLPIEKLISGVIKP